MERGSPTRNTIRFAATVAVMWLAPAALPFADGGWIGLRVTDAQNGGVRVLDVCEKGPANEAGVKRGDLITAVNGAAVKNSEAFVASIRALSPGATVTLTAEHPRLGRRALAVRIGEKPAQDPEKACESLLVQFRTPGTFAEHTHPHKVRAAYAGVMVQEMTPALREYFGAPRDAGILVAEVDTDGPARGILQAGDVLLSTDGKTLSCGADLMASVRDKVKGDILELRIVRKGRSQNVSLPLDERERARLDIGVMLAGKGACSSERGEACRFLWHGSEEDVQAGLERLRSMLHGSECADEMRKRAERQKMLEDKLLELQKKLREVQEQLRQKSAPPI